MMQASRNQPGVAHNQSRTEQLERMPEVLYKYSGLSGHRLGWMRDLIVESKLYFAKPSSFNDPLDCRIPPSYDASAFVIEQYWRGFVKQNHPHDKLRNHRKAIRRMIRDSKTPTGQARLTKRLFESVDQNGIACFAKDATNMLLWSYYTEGHSGIAVRFKVTLENLLQMQRLLIPLEVQYQIDFPEIDYYSDTNPGFLRTVLGTKAVVWAHEQEWRLVLVGYQGLLRLPPEMIDGVIMGMRIDPAHERSLRGWIEERESRLELLRVSNRSRSFELELVPA